MRSSPRPDSAAQLGRLATEPHPPGAPREAALATAYAAARARYRDCYPESRRLFDKACHVLPGGNTRSSLYTDPFPITITRASGSRMWDADGYEYVDLLGDHTAGLLGHSSPVTSEAIIRAMRDGLNYGGQSALEEEAAALLIARFASLERVRFTNSGTEANLMALQAARALTGRSKVVVFDGAYHGAVLGFGNGPSPLNVPFEFIVVEYNDTSSFLDSLERHHSDIAAVIVEPMLGSAGCIPAADGFLECVRESTAALGVVLIFDEVMTSRLAWGGLQQVLDIRPDMTTLGKYVCGGLSCGVFGGRDELMRQFDPRTPGFLPHAGTFNNNRLSLSAAVATLRAYTFEVAEAHNTRGDHLRRQIAQRLHQRGSGLQVTGQGSMLNLHPISGPIASARDAQRADDRLRTIVHIDLLQRGFWVGPRGLISLSLALSADELREFVDAVDAVAASRETLVGL